MADAQKIREAQTLSQVKRAEELEMGQS